MQWLVAGFWVEMISFIVTRVRGSIYSYQNVGLIRCLVSVLTSGSPPLVKPLMQFGASQRIWSGTAKVETIALIVVF